MTTWELDNLMGDLPRLSARLERLSIEVSDEIRHMRANRLKSSPAQRFHLLAVQLTIDETIRALTALATTEQRTGALHRLVEPPAVDDVAADSTGPKLVHHGVKTFGDADHDDLPPAA